MAQKSMIDHMKSRNAMQLASGDDSDNTVVVSSSKKQMPEEEGNARKKAYNEKFGSKYGPAKPLRKKAAPRRFESREDLQEYFKNNPR